MWIGLTDTQRKEITPERIERYADKTHSKSKTARLLEIAGFIGGGITLAAGIGLLVASSVVASPYVALPLTHMALIAFLSIPVLPVLFGITARNICIDQAEERLLEKVKVAKKVDDLPRLKERCHSAEFSFSAERPAALCLNTLKQNYPAGPALK